MACSTTARCSCGHTLNLILKMAESEAGLIDLMHDLDLEDVNDTGHQRDINVKIINGFYHQMKLDEVFKLLSTTRLCC